MHSSHQITLRSSSSPISSSLPQSSSYSAHCLPPAKPPRLSAASSRSQRGQRFSCLCWKMRKAKVKGRRGSQRGRRRKIEAKGKRSLVVALCGQTTQKIRYARYIIHVGYIESRISSICLKLRMHLPQFDKHTRERARTHT